MKSTVDVISSEEFSDMAEEMHRLMSFGSWPRKDQFPQPSALASAGFYYTGEDDKTRCFSCKGEVFNWRPDMYPDVIHRTRYPHCRLVKGEETRNRPMPLPTEVYGKEEAFFCNDFPSISHNTNIVKQPSNPHGMTNAILVNHRRPPAASNSPTISSSLMNPSGDMSLEQQRVGNVPIVSRVPRSRWQGNAFGIAGPLWGEMDSPHKGSVVQSVGVFFVVIVNNILNKQ